MRFRLYILLVAALLLTFFAAGCGNKTQTVPVDNGTVSPADQDTENPAPPVNNEPSVPEPGEADSWPLPDPVRSHVVIGESTDKPGWKVFASSGHYVYVTDDWRDFRVFEGAESVSYSFQFPEGLEFSGFSIFNDEEGYKKIEIMSGVIYLAPGQTPWDNEIQGNASDYGYSTTIITEENIAAGSLEGKRRVEKGSFPSHDADNTIRDWFIHRYIVTDGSHAFAISFWEPDLMQLENKRLFDEIVATFSFEDNDQAQVLFRGDRALVGDQVGEMTITFIERFFDDYIWIGFNGKATVTGRYAYTDDALMGEFISFHADTAQEGKIPKMLEDERDLWFSFSNHDFAHETFGPVGSTGQATIVIDSYFIDYTPTEAYNTAELLEVIEITED